MRLFGLKPETAKNCRNSKKLIKLVQNCMDSWTAFHSRVKTGLKMLKTA